MGISNKDFHFGKSFLDNVEHFLQTDDFEPKTLKTVCLNPTLLTLDNKRWEVSFNNNK